MRFDKSGEMAIMKEDLLKAIEIYDNTIKFMITCTLTVISLGITVNSPILLFLTYPIIFLLGKKVFFWRDSVAKKGAYCSVFLEGDDSGYHWETINSIVPDGKREKKNRTIDFSKDLEINFLLLLNTAVIFLKFYLIKTDQAGLEEYIIIGVAFVLFIISAVYFYRKDSVSEVRQMWITSFSKMKEEMERKEALAENNGEK